MGIYKVLKDFPSRNGVRQYKVGQNIQLDDNSRTKALVGMGYIKNESNGLRLARLIVDAISSVRGIKDVSVSEAGHGTKRHAYMVTVEEK